MISKTESQDEERLLQLYRNCSDSERNEILYRVTRLRFAPSFGEWAQSNGFEVKLSDAYDHLHEELEEGLRDICPRELLRDVGAAMTDQQFSGLWQGAWESIAPVILGTSQHDGLMADKLYAEVAGTAPNVWRGKSHFSRRDALELIETWREAALQRTCTG